MAPTREWLSDHLHPRVCFHKACTGDESKDTQMIGDWRGLALAPDGDLWVAGKWTAGKIRWTQPLSQWHARIGADTFAIAFGDPYDAATGRNPPVFRPPREGDPVDLSTVTVAKDGTVWFASGPQSSSSRAYGIASWDGKAFRYFDPIRDAGLPESNVRDLVALTGGRPAHRRRRHPGRIDPDARAGSPRRARDAARGHGTGRGRAARPAVDNRPTLAVGRHFQQTYG